MPVQPRVLAILGSGETAPTMVSVHSALFARLGPGPFPAVLLDSPYGFQGNADDLTARAVGYFGHHVGRPVGVASLRSLGGAGAVELQSFIARVEEAQLVFAGPGSPSYALAQWRGTPLAPILAEKLATGPCVVTFASAAAVTLGRLALPVYEIYKVGETPHWLPGLDLLGSLGIDCVLVPHYDNGEGGTHDTRFCYMGESRLRHLETLLPDGTFILGVDEHTACILDLEAGTMSVSGRGAVTLRRQGAEQRFPTGTTVPLEVVRAGGRAMAGGGAGGAPVPGEPGLPAAPPAGAPSADPGAGPLVAAVDGAVERFGTALAARDVDGCLEALLALEEVISQWSADSLEGDVLERARGRLRTMLVQLGDLAREGARDPRDQVAPFVDAVVALRDTARQDRRWADADVLRDVLLERGVEVRDSPAGSSWELVGSPHPVG